MSAVEIDGLVLVVATLERLVYRVAEVDPVLNQDWKRYTPAPLVFSFAGFAFVYLLQRLQGLLPMNRQAFGAVTLDLAFNTAVSFATNTNWQGYGGETTMSYLTQMLGLGVQSFVSAASGMAVLVALLLVSQGVVQSSAPYGRVTLIEPVTI